jgi:hypothetical protein
MKANVFSIILLTVMAGCSGKKQSNDELIIVDVSKSYPEKELILQDIMDVEYIALETTDEFITQGWVEAIGKKYIVVRNNGRDGELFIFDRQGKGVGRFNRMGQGPEDYTFTSSIVLDEDKNELFVHDYSPSKILVYDLSGNFMRSFKYNNEDDTLKYSGLKNYDREHLIGYDATGDYHEARQFYHAIISKQDGSIVRKIQVPFKEKKTTMLRGEEGEIVFTSQVTFNSIYPYQNHWLLSQPSSDTIYKFLPDYSMIPLIVRTPSIQSMNPEVFLSPQLLTERYYFMTATGKNGKFENGYVFFPSTDLAFDRQENNLFEYSIYNDDYSTKRRIGIAAPVNTEIAFWRRLEAYQLVESYEKGELKGRLKEIAAKLDAEDNPVIMLVRHK